jgi:ATP-dependent Clp protease ATP-binding subunit ClpA
MSNHLKELNISSPFHPFLEDLSDQAERDDRIPFIGREKEIDAIMETLLRRLKHNLLLIGKSGVGKTALITEVASRINQQNVPRALKGKIVLEFSLNRFFYSRNTSEALLSDLEQLFSELLKQKDKVILFLDEMHLQSLPDEDKKSRQKEVQNLLKSYVANRELNIIAAATPETYYKSIKSDEVMSLNFCPLVIGEPGEPEMMEILKGVTPYFEQYYSLKIPARLFKKIIFLLEKFTPHRAFPHKAIDLIDMCCSRASLKQNENLSLDIIYRSISAISRLPLDIVKTDPAEHRMNIRGYLEKEVVNQRDALAEISRIIKLTGMKDEINRSRPEGIFLFLGPAGVGKSYVARQIAHYLFGGRDKMRVIDIQDYEAPEDFKKLISDDKADPGILVREVDQHPFSVILFENIGDAHEEVLDCLGQTITKGEIIDAAGKKHSVLDWVDEIIEFEPLSEEHLEQIAGHKVSDIRSEIKSKYNSEVNVDEAVLDALSKESLQEGGFAHMVSELIERRIKIRLLDLIANTGNKQAFDVIMKDNAIEIKKHK